MKQLAEYTTKNLYSEFKPKEICFVVAKSYKYVNELSYITDDMNDALSFAKENGVSVIILAGDTFDTGKISAKSKRRK